MQLSKYPARIAELSRVVNELDHDINTVKRAIQLFELSVDSEVAFDLTLRNETQRQVKRQQLLVDEENGGDVYQQHQGDLIQLLKQKADAMTALEQARNEFSAAKLEMKQAIAQQLIGSEYRELVGV